MLSARFVRHSKHGILTDQLLIGRRHLARTTWQHLATDGPVSRKGHSPHRRQGQRQVRAHHLGCRARRDRHALEVDHRRIRSDRDPALQLPRHRGLPQRAQRRRSVLQQARRHHQRAHVLRFRRLYRLHHDGRPDGRPRSRELPPFEVHHHLGRQPGQYQFAPLADHHRGAEERRQGRGGRSAAQPHGATGAP